MAKKLDFAVRLHDKVLKLYTQFKTRRQLQRAVQRHINKIERSNHSKTIKSALIDLLLLLKSMSYVYIGVSYMKEQTIANRLNVSKRSITTYTRLLIELGVIDKINTKRANKKQGANILVIKPVSKNLRTIKSFYSTPYNKKPKKAYKTSKLANMLPKVIKSIILSFFKTNEIKGVKKILDYWLKTCRYNLSDNELYFVSTKAIQAVKSSRNVRNKLGLFSYEFGKLLEMSFTPEPLPLFGEWLFDEPADQADSEPSINVNALLWFKAESEWTPAERLAVEQWKKENTAEIGPSENDIELPY